VTNAVSLTRQWEMMSPLERRELRGRVTKAGSHQGLFLPLVKQLKRMTPAERAERAAKHAPARVHDLLEVLLGPDIRTRDWKGLRENLEALRSLYGMSSHCRRLEGELQGGQKGLYAHATHVREATGEPISETIHYAMGLAELYRDLVVNGTWPHAKFCVMVARAIRTFAVPQT